MNKQNVEHLSVIKKKKRKGTFRYIIPKDDFVGHCPWGRKESDTTELLHFTLSVISLTYLLDTEGHVVRFHLQEILVTRFIKTESRMVVAWGMRGTVGGCYYSRGMGFHWGDQSARCGWW